jgi:GNAT superfamily N-acetyltransferase
MIEPAGAEDVLLLARWMADSPLLSRYRVTLAGARKALSAAVGAGDLILCSRSREVEGFAWLSFAPRVLNGAAYLRLLLVAAPGRGVGAQLLAAAEAAVRPHANHLYLLATTDNIDARRFYERHGYRHVGDLPGLVWPDLDEAFYHKPLRGFAERLNT